MKRREGLAKLTGVERYADDVPLGELLWGATVRSPAPRGRIREIRFGKSVDWSDFVVVDARDIPGRNAVYLKDYEQPALADGRVRHVHEPVLLLAHRDRDRLRRAVAEVEVLVDPEPAVLDFRLPPRADQIQHGKDNVFQRLRIEKGDVEGALAAAPFVVEGVYETGAQEHVYLETQGMIAHEEDGVLVVRGSMQCPYFVLDALVPALGRTEAELRVIQLPTGGGFGGKEEFPSMVAIHAALLALKAKQPVKIVYDRGEDLAATTKRHPARIRHRSGVDREGRLLAQEVELLVDGGAYPTLSSVVLSRAVIHAGGPYRCEHVRIDGRVVLTNLVPFGAFRGFGNPQAHFASERHMDRIAAELGLEPAELRRRNLLRDGDETATGQVIRDGVDRVALMDQALELAGWEEKRARPRALHAARAATASVEGSAVETPRRRGIGLATYYHGAGFTGAGEVHLASRLHVAGLPDGRVEVRSATVEMGQGSLTVLTQIAAERLGLEPEEILFAPPDTGRVPNSGPTVASRTTMVVGRLLEKACDDLLHRVGLVTDARGEVVREAIAAWHRENPDAEIVGEGRYDPPPGIEWDDESYRGDAYGAYAWAAHVAEVEVDLRTLETRVLDYVAVQEAGRIINETLARGQVQGGVAQGIGWALQEECRWREGAMENVQLTNYIIPTSADLPPLRVEFVEHPYPHGGLGAKGLAELPIEGPAPAIANAIADATGLDPRQVPMTPEYLLSLSEEAVAGQPSAERRSA
ncbi:MAG: xanthine dehydrogenase family protein molybdopterin-binding subunit [Gemmatimonadota bacterium]